MSKRGNQEFSIVSAIDPAASANGTITSDVIDAALYDKVVFIIQSGVCSSKDVKMVFNTFEGTKTATVATSLDSYTWTATTTGSDENLQWIVEVPTSIMNMPKYRYLSASLVTSVSTLNNFSMVGLGMGNRFAPGNVGDLASVENIDIAE